MLKRSGSKVTFVLPPEAAPVSVVGDFNGWDPCAHPLKKRSNGTLSVSVVLPPGPHAFRYLDGKGHFFDDPECDAEPNGYGETHSVLVVDDSAAA